MNDNLIIQHLYSLSPNLFFFFNLNLVIICRRLDCHSFSDLVNLLAAGHLEACNSFQKNRLKNKQWNCYYRAHVSSFERVSDSRLHVPHKKLPVIHKLSVLLRLLFTRTFLNL